MWLDRLEHEPFLPLTWFKHQRRDAYWKRGSVCEDFAAIEAAVLAVGGWHDGYCNTVANLLANLKAPAKGIMGPWIHKYPHYGAPEPRIGFLQEALRWWDRWLKGVDTGADQDPAYRAYVMDSVRPARWHPARPGRWVAETIWPSPRIESRRFDLLRAGDPSRIVDSPQTCGLAGGEYFPFTFGPELPGDQRVDDALSTAFDLAALPEPLDILGAPEVAVKLSSDTPQANLAVRLCDIHPDGASELIAFGVLNLSHRGSHEHPAPLPSGSDVAVRVRLDQAGYRVPAGHRLRVSLSTALWPMIWPAPGRSRLAVSEAVLHLPVRPLSAGDEVAFPPAEGAAPWRTELVRPASSSRHVTEDQGSGTATLAIHDDFGCVRDADHGMVHGSEVQERWTIHPDDPLSARVECRWTQTFARGDWSVRTQTHASLRADKGHFHLAARIEAFEGDAPVFARDFAEAIPRDNL